MKYVREIDDMYHFPAWSGGKTTLDRVVAEGKSEKLAELANEILCDFGNRIPTDTEINDWLWFESDYIYERLGISHGGKKAKMDKNGGKND